MCDATCTCGLMGDTSGLRILNPSVDAVPVVLCNFSCATELQAS